MSLTVFEELASGYYWLCHKLSVCTDVLKQFQRAWSQVPVKAAVEDGSPAQLVQPVCVVITQLGQSVYIEVCWCGLMGEVGMTLYSDCL